MGKSRAQFGQAEGKKDEPLLLSDDLRGWIDRVIPPILVQQFIQRVCRTSRTMDNTQHMRYGIYARYSSDLQRQFSIEDQIRKCDEFGQAQGWVVVKDCIYTDEAVSGVSTQRPGLQRMLAAAVAAHRPFDVILVDDTSRISRSL